MAVAVKEFFIVGGEVNCGITAMKMFVATNLMRHLNHPHPAEHGPLKKLTKAKRLTLKLARAQSQSKASCLKDQNSKEEHSGVE